MRWPFRRTARLRDYLPVRGLGSDHILRADGVPVGVLEVSPVDPLEEGGGEGVLSAYRSLINSLDFPVQILVRLTSPDLCGYRSRLRSVLPEGLTEELQALARALDSLLAELQGRNGVLDRRFYLVVPGPGTGTDGLQGLERRMALLGTGLARCGLAAVWLDGAALRAFWEGCLRGTTPVVLRDAGQALVSVQVRSCSLQIDGSPFRALALARWPRYLHTGWLPRLLTLGVPLDLALHVVPEEPSVSVRRLEWHRVQLESGRSLALKRGRTPSPEQEVALEDLARLRDDLQRGRERLFLTALLLLVRAEDEGTLARREERVRAFVSASLGSLEAPRFRQDRAHRAILPLTHNPLGFWRRVDTSTLACLFPFSPPDLDTRRGLLFGLDLRSGCPVILDPFEEAGFLNANLCVLAQSGAGKSYAVKLLILRGLLQELAFYVIDPEGEYTELARVAGGRVLRPGIPGQGLNPFVVGERDEASLAYRVGALRRLLEVMLGRRLSPQQRAELDGALWDYYHSDGQDASFEAFYAFLKQRSALALPLRPFAEGSLRFLLGEGKPLEAEANITVFDLSHLEPDLRPAVAHLCAETVWGLARRQPHRRVLVVDEAWALLSHPEGAAFLSGVAKRARKHRLGLVTITQDVQDLLESERERAVSGHSGRTVLQNSAFKLLLRQDPAVMGLVAETFGLGPVDREWLLSCGRGEGLLITPKGRAFLKVEATPEEHRLITGALEEAPTVSEGKGGVRTW